VLLLAAGGLGWWWASAYGEHTSQAASPAPGPAAVSEKKESVQTAETIKTNGAQVKANVAPEAALSGVLASPAEETARPAPHAVVSEASMPIQVSAGQLRQLIRSGKQELSSIR
jgi:cytoskeletal protein RodZ